MVRLLIRLVINAVALWVAAAIVPGLGVSGNIGGLFVVAIIFGLVNAFIKPIVSFFTCPLYVLTLGLFTFVVNALMLLLTEWLSQGRLEVDGFFPALFGSIIISIVSVLLSIFLPDND